MAIAGKTISAGSQLMGGFTASRAAKEQAKLARENARTQLLKGEFEAGQIRDREERMAGSAQAHYASAGLDLQTGSPALALMLSADQAMTDQALVRSGALSQSSQQYENAAALSDKARQTRIASILGAGTSLLMGASKIPGLDNMGGTAGSSFSFQPNFNAGFGAGDSWASQPMFSQGFGPGDFWGR
jgi:hypothetical protein